MRLIDADELKELFHEVIGRIAKRPDINFNMEHMIRASAMVIEMINDAPTVTPEPHWIPVTERLPKEDGNYLVSGKWGSGKEAVGDCLFSVEDGYFQTAWNFDVLAWCELPEPYKGVTT